MHIGDDNEPINWISVVDNNGLHGMRKVSGDVELSAGWHKFFASYFNKTGAHGFIAEMAGPDFPEQVIPAEFFMHGGTKAPSMDASARVRTDTSGCVKPNYLATFDEVMGRITATELNSTLHDRDAEQHLAENFADRMSFEWYNYQMCMHALPQVCEAGQECRREIQEAALKELQQQWFDAFEQIREKLDNAWIHTSKILKDGYREEALCEPECECDPVDLTQVYIDHKRLEMEIEREIEVDEEVLKQLIQQSVDITTNCPDYEDRKSVV